MNSFSVMFLKKNWLGIILWFLNILSIFFILQIVFDAFPLFESKHPLIRVDKINSLVVDCSIGIITSTLFYILLVYIPEKRKANTARKAQAINLQFLAEHMQFFIIYLVKEYSLQISDNDIYYSNIPLEEFRKVNNSIFTTNYKYYPLYCNYKNRDLIVLIGNQKFGIKVMYKTVTDLIHRILSNPIVIYEDNSLIDLLNDISSCRLFNLFRIYISKESIAIDWERYCLVDQLSPILIEYYQLYIRLLKYASPNSFSINDDIVLPNENE